jgi:subtilisin family serine protease
MKRAPWIVISIIVGLSLLGGYRASAAPARTTPVIDPAVTTMLSGLPANQQIKVIAILNDQVDVRSAGGRDRAEKQRNVAIALRAKADATQGNVQALAKARQSTGHVGAVTPLWIINAIALQADRSVIDEVSRLPEVQRIVLDAAIQAPALPTATMTITPEANLSLINAPALWNLGYQGQGIVIASMDTGVDYTHPDLSAQWRGGSDSWFDPYGEHAVPTDLNGHGTWTMGLMVGGSNGGTAIGVAPQAKWIAVKMFNDAGTSTISAIHQGYQWLLDPDGNPNTPDAPNIVNNSWTFGSIGCNLTFEPDLQSLVAAGITPVFAAGNYGPNAATSASPANNPDAFSVGATDNSDVIASFSSRGSNACTPTQTYPSVVAPGVNVNTTDLFGLYNTVSGTSFSAPHVSGALALLLSAFPNLSVSQQEIALTATALDLGTSGPDNIFGAGRIDALAAYNAVRNGALPTPTPTNIPSPMSTSTPTAVPPTPTNTALPPTATPTPLPPTPTNTPLPPTPTATPTSDLIFADGFEAGNLSAWTSTGGTSGRLSVTGTAKQGGSYGLQAAISNGTSGYVIDGSPNNEISYHARFYFNPNGATISSTAQDIFDGLNASGQIVFRVQVRRSNGQYQIRGVVTRSGGTTSTNWYAINNAYHALEIAWKSASSASVSLYLDGSLKQTLTGLNTGAYTIRSVQLGPQTGLSGSPGAEYFDSFVSTRSSYIGP